MSNPLETLRERLGDTADVYVNAGVDPRSYFASLADDIKRNECQPFQLTAVVMEPGIPGFKEGDLISGFCVARSGGRWLVYRSEEDVFYAFWGTSSERLGAHGVYGSPLYCWSA